MTALVIYDSKWGNTELVARAVAEGLGADAQAFRVGEAGAGELASAELIVLGSPVIGGKPTKAMQALLKALAVVPVPGRRFAAFDTRMTIEHALKFGRAADWMAEALGEAKATLVGSPAGFVVTSQKGPLAEGELERARNWGQTLA